MKKIKNIVREVLNEEMGVQTEIKDMSKIMTNKVLEKLATDFKGKKTLLYPLKKRCWNLLQFF